jgi:hypothetical protein
MRLPPSTVVLCCLLGLVASSVGAQAPSVFPAVPCEDPARALATVKQKTCACDSVPEFSCAYDPEHAGCLEDTLVCRTDACQGLLDPNEHPVSVRCSEVPADQTNLPNIVIILSDDANWAFWGDVVNDTTGERYSLWDEYYQNLVCHGGPFPGRHCKAAPKDCITGTCETWTRLCRGGVSDGSPCKQDSDCEGAGASCVECGDGECSTNPMKTPELDRLATSGAFFPVAHTSASVCAPSIMSILTGHHPKDFEPQPGRVLTRTLPRLLSRTHCSVSVGKTWVVKYDQEDQCFDCCCEEFDCCGNVELCPRKSCNAKVCCGDRATGFHYSVQKDFKIGFGRIGREKHTLEKGACLMRQANLEGKAFLGWLLAYVPHAPGGAPEAMEQCYVEARKPSRVRVDGRGDVLPSPDYLGRISWFDCILGTFLEFLETTPDTRFCAHPAGGHVKEAHNCGPCTRPCDAATPCGEGVACVDGRCDSDVPCLIDTTVITYINDNGLGIQNSKTRHSENGYRNPIILSYGGLGSFTGIETADLPPRVEPRIYPNRMAHAMDFLPTVMHYADCENGECLTDCPSQCGGCGSCIYGDCSDPRCLRHRGYSLRDLAEGGDDQGWRRYLLGHRSTSNGKTAGTDQHYLRTGRLIATGVAGTTGGGACGSDQDCVNQGWDAAEVGGLSTCVNGICTKTCETRGDCTLIDGARTVSCINGLCATGSACKLYHDPAECKQRLYNLGNDPDEQRNLLRRESDRDEADPLRVCFDETPGTAGRQHFEELTCDLVRWCLEDCTAGDNIECPECCAAQHCAQCEAVDCAQCLGAETCVQIQAGQCVDCRRPCPNGNSDCGDLGTSCDSGSGKCTSFCRLGLCAVP